MASERHKEAFLEMMAVERAAAINTLDAYRRDLDDLDNYLTKRGGAPLSARPADLAGYMRALADAGMATRTQARRLSCLRQFYGFVFAEGWRADDPTSRLDAPRLGRSLPKYLSEKQVGDLLDAARALESPQGEMMTALLELLYATGLRVSELVGLPYSAVARDPALLVVRGKGDKERMVPLSDPARAALRVWLPLRQDLLGKKKTSRWLFPGSGKTGHLTRAGFARALLRVGMKAGIDPRRLSPHVLRHAFATHLLAHGADLRVVQELLGHADIATTEIYTHVLEEPKVRLVNQHHPLAALLKPKS
ncbi:site-specific tyrosine recombinase XerD [Magnetospirillum gryphiswaldense]|uniref:Tyrosine recombinase XerC n=1 Tax=Magnetospirillum gryphiswaldense TaxID=55518 RepID=A4TU74_9PROT|nr:site-specific tyrosine recombinase XerD [Magnetospirillum gryphiswaldense]AVM75496.1 Tyrosine recombinase XerD [Magnetospirillum gryphiswaldense MSR-1]AVM79399.1 Tyrosine recombinase XerD [Magnetospirillum gryphiswaldense]CAM74181.1 Tyrosine recombinase xerD [Magnetospirillum gryphiswaldense MSR-1]